jgi:hypothetical protein
MKLTIRAALAAIAIVLPLAAADISGSWTFAGDVVGNPISMKCTLKQEGTKVTGTCTHEGRGASPTTGTVEGDKVILTHSVEAYELTFTGTLGADGTSIKGGIAVANVEGTFSGTKDPAAK